MQKLTTGSPFILECIKKKSKKIVIFLITLFLTVQIQAQESKQLVILHNNDTHSRIEPLPENDPKYPNHGGIIRQNACVEEIRSENKNVLLFHCGDFVQGTPYFNLFKGQAEIACMNFMKYDAACLGNHEFDYGLDNLAEMIKVAKFPLIATNLDFTETVLEGLTRKYLILHRDNLKIGVIGLTVSPEGLVALSNYEGMKYMDPIRSANETAGYLKNEENCDLVICLSHLGYFPKEDNIGDITLAKESHDVDIILGGHTHTFLRFADSRLNRDGEQVVINQTGDRGIYMGRLDVLLKKRE
ncbi:MAG: metallophosphoesterase [Dysgonamonadaceae bacterium]|jgi:5'-nucleotidase|nr:metallophosphoesterase [Dysgonamonadaceae bacterium]